MARSLRIEFPGAFYHVIARGHRGQAIFLNDDDREYFLQTLGEACGMTGWRVHAWVLMNDHYHLFLETPEANLVQTMKWLQNNVTLHHNLQHGIQGPLFGDRYKAVPVEATDVERYRTLSDYIHLNPVRARLVRPAKNAGVADYPWSSVARGYALAPGKRPKWMAAAEGLRHFELPDSAAGRRRFIGHLDRRAREEKTGSCGVPEPGPDFDARRSHLRRRRTRHHNTPGVLRRHLRRVPAPGDHNGCKAATDVERVVWRSGLRYARAYFAVVAKV